MMTGPRRQLAIAEPAQLTAQGLRADRDRELVPDPLRQIEQPPAHHAMRRRDRSVLDDLRQCPAVLLVKQWRRARRLAVDQTVGTLGVETDYPVAHDLKRHAADPRRLAARPAIIDRRKDRKSTRLNSSHSCASRMPTS